MREASRRGLACTIEAGSFRACAESYLSEAARRRSRWGSVRGCPVLSSHFSPGLAPQVGQRTAKAGIRFVFMATYCNAARQSRCSNVITLCPPESGFSAIRGGWILENYTFLTRTILFQKAHVFGSS